MTNETGAEPFRAVREGRTCGEEPEKPAVALGPCKVSRRRSDLLEDYAMASHCVCLSIKANATSKPRPPKNLRRGIIFVEFQK